MDNAQILNNLYSAASLQDFLATVEYRVARTRQELEQAYALVYKEYRKRGYIDENQSGLKLSLFNALPQTTTFIGIADKQIVTTATVVTDSPLGLPMDEAYHAELNEFRHIGARLCEVTMLASDTDLFKNGVSMMLNSKKLFFVFFLFKLIYDYARDVQKLDHICIAINPKHKLTYDFLFFKEMGGLKAYKSVNSAPAIAEHLDIKEAEKKCQAMNKEGLYKMFIVRKTPLERFSDKYEMTPEDLRYFFVEKSDVFNAAPMHKLDYVKCCYKSYDFARILQ